MELMPKYNFVIIAYDDDFEQYRVVWAKQAWSHDNAWTLFEIEAASLPDEYSRHVGQKLIMIDTASLSVSHAYLRQGTTTELER